MNYHELLQKKCDLSDAVELLITDQKKDDEAFHVYQNEYKKRQMERAKKNEKILSEEKMISGAIKHHPENPNNKGK